MIDIDWIELWSFDHVFIDLVNLKLEELMFFIFLGEIFCAIVFGQTQFLRKKSKIYSFILIEKLYFSFIFTLNVIL